MRTAFIFGLAIAAVARAALRLPSGLYRISSVNYPRYVITQDGVKIAAYGGTSNAQQVWSVVFANASAMASIQNHQTGEYITAICGEIVPSLYAFRWVITERRLGSQSTFSIASGRTVVAAPGFDKQLVLAAPDSNDTSQEWSFIETWLPRHPYKVWNEALGLYLEQVGDAVLGRPASNASSQIWRVDGTSAGGGFPSLQNEATHDFLTVKGTQPAVGKQRFSWSQSLVGGQMALYTHNSTLTVGADGTIILSPGTGTHQNQTWVFVPVA